jgi:hypothetical protein
VANYCRDVARESYLCYGYSRPYYFSVERRRRWSFTLERKVMKIVEMVFNRHSDYSDCYVRSEIYLAFFEPKLGIGLGYYRNGEMFIIQVDE